MLINLKNLLTITGQHSVIVMPAVKTTSVRIPQKVPLPVVATVVGVGPAAAGAGSTTATVPLEKRMLQNDLFV